MAGQEPLAPHLALGLAPHRRLQLRQPLLQLRDLGGEMRASDGGTPHFGLRHSVPPLPTLTLAVWANCSCSGFQYSSKVTASPVSTGALAGLFPSAALLLFATSSCCSRRLGRGQRWARGPRTAPRGRCRPPPAAPGSRDPTHLARAPSGSAKSMAAAGPSSFSRWLETSCCCRPSTCLAKAMGVSSSSAAASFTVLWGGGRKGGRVTPPGDSLPTAPQRRGDAHLDLLHLPEQLLHLVLQPLVPLLGRLFGTQPLAELQREERGGQAGAHGLPAAPGTQEGGGGWDVGTQHPSVPAHTCAERQEKGSSRENKRVRPSPARQEQPRVPRNLPLTGDPRQTCWGDNPAGQKQPRRLLSASPTTASSKSQRSQRGEGLRWSLGSLGLWSSKAAWAPATTTWRS